MIIRALINVLAGYRILRLVQIDSITLPARQYCHRLVRRREYSQKWLELLNCPFCLSAWIAFGIIALQHFLPSFWGMTSDALALWTLIGILGYLDMNNIP